MFIYTSDFVEIVSFIHGLLFVMSVISYLYVFFPVVRLFAMSE